MTLARVGFTSRRPEPHKLTWARGGGITLWNSLGSSHGGRKRSLRLKCPRPPPGYCRPWCWPTLRGTGDFPDWGVLQVTPRPRSLVSPRLRPPLPLSCPCRSVAPSAWPLPAPPRPPTPRSPHQLWGPVHGACGSVSGCEVGVCAQLVEQKGHARAQSGYTALLLTLHGTPGRWPCAVFRL